MTKTNSALWLVPGLLLAIGCQTAAAGQRYGKEPESKTPKVTLAELIAKPDAYEGKDVVVDGQFGGTCEDGDFYFKDKLEIIEVIPPPEGLPRDVVIGTPLTIQGVVVVKAHGAESPQESAREDEGGAESEVKVQARLVQVNRT